MYNWKRKEQLIIEWYICLRTVKLKVKQVWLDCSTPLFISTISKKIMKNKRQSTKITVKFREKKIAIKSDFSILVAVKIKVINGNCQIKQSFSQQ